MKKKTYVQKLCQFSLRFKRTAKVGLKTLLQSAGLTVKEESRGLDMVFYIRSGEKEVNFYLQNLLLEIATIDRDEEHLRFDKNLRNFEFFLNKTSQLVKSKLKFLAHHHSPIVLLISLIYFKAVTGWFMAHWITRCNRITPSTVGSIKAFC